MPEKISLRFEFDKGTDLKKAASALSERLSNVKGVEAVDAVPEKPRITGVEVVAAIAVGIAVVKTAREGVEELRKLLHELKTLVTEVQGLQDVKLEIGPRKVSLDKVKDAELEELAGDEEEGTTV